MNPFVWLAIILGYMASTDETKPATKPTSKPPTKPTTKLEDLPKGTTIDINEDGEVTVVKPPDKRTPTTPKPTPSPEEEESLPEEIEDWMDVVDQGLPYLDWLLDEGEDWLEDDAEYDEDDYYEGDYWEDDYYYEDYPEEDWMAYEWEDDYTLIE